MIEQARRWLTPPVFPDDEAKTRRATLLHNTLLLTLFICALFILGNVLGKRIPEVAGVINSAVFVANLFLIWLLKRGQVQLASVIVVVLGLIGVTAIVASLGTIRTPATATFLLVSLVAGTLFERRGAFLVSLVSSLLIGGLTWLETAGMLPLPDHTITVTQWIAYTVLLLAVTLVIYFDQQTNYRALTLAAQELAKRQRIEHELRDSQSRLQRAESVAHFGNWAFDMSQRIVRASPGARQIYGLQGEIWSIAEVQTIPLPEYRATLDTALSDLIEHGRPYNIEFRIQRPTDGQLRDIHSIAEYDASQHTVFGVIHDITERKQIETALQISLTKYQTLFDSLPLGVTVADRTGQIIERNQEANRLLGLSKEAQLQRQIDGEEWRIIRPNGSPMPPDEFASVRALAEQQQVGNVEMGLVKSATDITWISVTAAPLSLIGGVVIAYMDISERRRAEAALRDSEEKYRVLFRESPDAYVIFKDGAFIDCNLAAEQMLRGDRSQILGRTPAELSPEFQPDGRRSVEAAQPIIAEALRSSTHAFEWTHQRLDGTDLHVEVSVTVMMLDGQSVLFATWRDVGARKEMEASLRQTQNQLAQLLQTTDQGIFGIDLEGCCTFVNRSGLKLLGYTLAECVGQNMHTLIHHSHPDGTPYPEADCPIYTTRQIGTGRRITDEVLWRKDGTPFQAEYSSYPIIDNGRIKGGVVTFSDITDRKRAEEALRQSQTRWQSIIKTSPDGICITTVEGVIQYASDKLLNLHHFQQAEEIVGRNIFDLVEESYHAEATRRLNEMLNGRYPGVAEYCVIRRDGSQFYAEVNAEILRDAHGQPTGILLVERDVTARKQTEEALAASNDFHLRLLNEAPALIWRADTSAQCDWFNETWLNFTGRSMAQELGNGWAAGVHPDDYERCLSVYLNAFAARQPFMMEYRLRHVSGEYRWIADYGMPFKTLTNEFGGYIGYCYDITERRQAETDLRRRTDYLAALHATTLELTGQLDLDRLFENIVTRAAALVDADGGFLDLVDLATNQLLPRVGVGVLSESLQLIAQPGEGVAGIVWQTGVPLVVNNYDEWSNRIKRFSIGQLGSLVGVPLLKDNRTLGVLGLAYETNSSRSFGTDAVDILTQFARLAAIAIENARLFETVQQELRERTKAEAALRDLNATLEQRVVDRTAELQAANERLLELDQLKDDFLARISHELRTPLTSIKIYLDLLENGKPEKRDKYMSTLHQEANRLQALIEEVLLFSQLNRTTTAAAMGRLDINNTIMGRRPAWERVSMERGLALKLHLRPDLPPAHTDSELLLHALNRLIENAVNYTQSGSVTVSTDLCDDQGQQWITIGVADTGPGISAEDLPHIFERFYRGRAAADYRKPGTGIGLSTCLEIAQRLNSRLTVNTQVGVGSTFTFWVPVANYSG